MALEICPVTSNLMSPPLRDLFLFVSRATFWKDCKKKQIVLPSQGLGYCFQIAHFCSSHMVLWLSFYWSGSLSYWDAGESLDESFFFFNDLHILSSSLSSWDMIMLNNSWSYAMIHWLMLITHLVNVNPQVMPLSFLWGSELLEEVEPKCSNPKYMQTLPMSPGRPNYSVLNHYLAWFFDIHGHFDSMVVTLMIYMARGCMQIHAQHMCWLAVVHLRLL